MPIKRFESTFYLFYVQHNKQFINTITSHIAIMLLKMGRMDKEQAAFEQLTLSDSIPSIITP